MQKIKLKNLSIVTSNDEDNIRFSRIYFLNGYAYASNKYVLVKHSLKSYGFKDEHIAVLNGKWVQGDSWDVIYKSKYVMVFENKLWFYRKNKVGHIGVSLNPIVIGIDFEVGIKNATKYKNITSQEVDFSIDSKLLCKVRKVTLHKKGIIKIKMYRNDHTNTLLIRGKMFLKRMRL